MLMRLHRHTWVDNCPAGRIGQGMCKDVRHLKLGEQRLGINGVIVSGAKLRTIDPTDISIQILIGHYYSSTLTYLRAYL